MLATAALGRWLPLAQTTELNLDLLESWKEPSTAVPVDARTRRRVTGWVDARAMR